MRPLAARDSRRWNLLWIGMLVAGGRLAAAEPHVPSADARPNILFLAVDDLRPELGCYGSSHVKSPHIDSLAASGVTFTQAHCQQAVCNPSRASLMTGLRPDTLRVWDLRTDFRQTVPDAVTLPQHLMAHGYHTVAIGKIFHNTIPDPRSWSEPKMHVAGYPFDPDAVYRQAANIEWLERRKETIVAAGQQARHIDRLGEWYLKAVATENADVPDNAYYDGAQTDAAVDKLRELAQLRQPFFFAVGYYRPHLPFNAPRPYWELYDPQQIPLAENGFLPRGAPPMAINTARELRGYADFKNAPRPDQQALTETQARLLKHGYLASVSYVDAQIGRLLDELDRSGLSDHTIVVLWGDHGWKLGEHRSWCKMTNYEIDTRVPLILRVPGCEESGKQCSRLVEFVDIYPTLCELAGVEVRGELEGTSFVPLLHDVTRPWKTAVFSQFLREGIWVGPDGEEYMGHAIRTPQYRYVSWMNWRTRQYVARELYDHRVDPAENVNVAELPESRDVVKALDQQLRQGWRAGAPSDLAASREEPVMCEFRWWTSSFVTVRQPRRFSIVAVVLCLAVTGGSAAWSQDKAVGDPGARAPDASRCLVGIYYFAGWWEPLPNKYAPHGEDWRGAYPGRIPLLGQYNDQATMDKEILAAAQAGVDFFQILWYPVDETRRRLAAEGGDLPPHVERVNEGLRLFLQSPENRQLRFTLEYVNHAPFEIREDADWETTCRMWCDVMRHPSYLRVGGRPVIKIHGLHAFHLQNGEDPAVVAGRFETLRRVARQAGLPDPLIGGGASPLGIPPAAWLEPYDYVTTYMEIPQLEKRDTLYPYEELVNLAEKGWTDYSRHCAKPYIPYLPAGWDPRPWRDPRPSFALPTRPQWKAALERVVAGLEKYDNLGLPTPTGRQKLLLIYAWNEFGEGGIVAPTRGDGYMKLQTITDVFGVANRNEGRGGG